MQEFQYSIKLSRVA